MDRYELVEGTSSKFWEVELSGNDLTVRFGRIGTEGQTKTKNFGDAAAAQKEWEKLVKEKTGKGYGLVGSGGTLAPVAAKIAVPKVPEPAQADTAVPHPPAPSVESPAQATVDSLVWPSGGFDWKAEWRSELPVVRGVHVPTHLSFPTVVPPIPTFEDSNYGFEAEQLAALAQELGKPWKYWGTKAGDHVTFTAMRERDPVYWLELMGQAWSHCWGDSPTGWATTACIASHGIPFAMELALTLWRGILGTEGARNTRELLDPLREAIACAAEETYEEALAAAESLRDAHKDHMIPCAYLFPHRTDWAEEAFVSGQADPTQALRECALPAASFAAYLRNQPMWIRSVRPGLFLQIHLHKEGAFEALQFVLAQSLGNKDATLEALQLLVRMRIPQMLPLLVSGIEHKEIRAALDKLADEFPAAMLSCVIPKALDTRDRGIEGWAVRLGVRKPEALRAALAVLDEGRRTRFEATLAGLQREDAPMEALPSLLRDPPWFKKVLAQPLPVLDTQPVPTADRIEWSADQLAAAAKYQAPDHWDTLDKKDLYANHLLLSKAGIKRMLAGEPLQEGDVEVQYSGIQMPLLFLVPENVRLAFWNSFPAQHWNTWGEFKGPAQAMLALHGFGAFPGLLRLVQALPDKGIPLADGIDSPRLVDPILRAFRNLKKSRDAAEHWIRAHPATVLAHALPLAFRAGAAAPRDDARHAIRWLAVNGFDAQVRDSAQGYGAALASAVDNLLSQDPALASPLKIPRLPTFFVPAALRRPELADGRVLPAGAVEHVGTMLAISKIDAPYGGLETIKSCCTPTSLAEFAWDLFEAWMAAGAPSKEAWAFAALGLLGDDETARRLAPRIREWPGESAHARAVTGLDLLAAIGTDVALMHLNGIAGKVKFKALQERAKEKIAAVAAARGFTPEELADRLVPDLGLDDNGTVELDFGPRKFYVGFDESLKPFVRDAQGARLKDLPKPIKSDDATLAEAATERYKQMKKDAKAVASLQLIRLEMGMVSRRRWPAQDFRLFFLEHPLMRHLAARLVWGVYTDGKLAANFRVAEDWTLADARDEHYALPEDATVGISHVLEISKEALEAFGQVFADYEIQQPFKQLGRETYALTSDEMKKDTLTRFAAKVVATGSVMGLVNRGWERGQAQDAGWVGEFSKMLPGELQADVGLDPGTVVGDMSYEPKQKLPTLTLRKRGTYDNNGLVLFGQLDPIIASEVLRDLDLLAPLQE